MFSSITNNLKESYNLEKGFASVESAIRHNASNNDELADDLFWLAKKSFSRFPLDSIRVAEESLFISPDKKKQKWLGFRLGDLKQYISAKTMLGELPENLFKTKYDRNKLETINAGYEQKISKNSPTFSRIAVSELENRLYSKCLSDIELSDELFALAKDNYGFEPFASLSLARKAYQLSEKAEIGSWISYRLYEKSVELLDSSLDMMSDVRDKFVTEPEKESAFRGMQKAVSESCRMTSQQVDWLKDNCSGLNISDGDTVPKFTDIIDVKIGLVSGDVFYDTIKDSVSDIIRITEKDYLSFCDRRNYDCLLVIPDDMDNKGWGKFSLCGESHRKLIDLIKKSRSCRIPALFISTDSSENNYSNILDYAKECDYIFSSSDRNVQRLKKDCGSSSVFFMEPFFNPARYNPVNHSVKSKSGVMYSGAWNRDDDRKCQDLSMIFKGILESKNTLRIFDCNYPDSRYCKYFPEEFFKYCSPAVPDALKYKVAKLFNWAVAVDSQKSSSDFLQNTLSYLACGNMVMANYNATINSSFPNVNLIHDSEEACRLALYFSGDELYERQMFNVRNAFAGYTAGQQLKIILERAGFEHKNREVSVLVVCDEITPEVRNSFDRQTFSSRQLVLYRDLNTKLLEKNDVITWFSDDFFYEEFYLEDMVNAFRYTSTSFITKDVYYDEKGLTEGLEHCFVNSFKSVYNTLFWIDDFEKYDVLNSVFDSKKGYAVDHFCLLSAKLTDIRNSEETDVDVAVTRLPYIRKNRVKDYKISVIIPVYNNGSSLFGKSFSSLQRSSMFADMEIVLVDDGSTDKGTVAVEDYLLRHYDNVRLYRYPAGGSGSASRPRNKGIELASGDYIAFLDPDDEIINDGYAKLYNDIRAGNYDMSAGNNLIYRGEVRQANNYQRIAEINPSAFFEHGLKNYLSELKFVAVRIHDFLIKRDSLEKLDIRQVEGAVGEDTLYSWQLLCSDLKIHFINENIQFYYADVESSVSNTVSPEFFQKLLLLQNEKMNFLKNNGLLSDFMKKKYNRYSTDYVLKKLSDTAPSDAVESVKTVYSLFSVFKDYCNGREDMIRIFMFLCRQKKYEAAYEIVRKYFGKQ